MELRGIEGTGFERSGEESNDAERCGKGKEGRKIEESGRRGELKWVRRESWRISKGIENREEMT